MKITKKHDRVEVSDFGGINLRLSLFCGQAFRWTEKSDGLFSGVVGNVPLSVRQEGDALIFYGPTVRQVGEAVVPYFDLDTDYGALLAPLRSDAFVGSAIEKYGILRIFNQPHFEALVSFIVSQCNNIPRIRSIVGRMCSLFGEPLGDGNFSFPAPGSLASAAPEELGALRSGYRESYIRSAASAVASGRTDLVSLESLGTAELRKELAELEGVGRKVADCVMLFSYERREVFPVDRHIKNVCAEIYPGGVPDEIGNSGLAQQYLFLARASDAGSLKNLAEKPG
ncbi:MAG: DNA-3-methyladenine glycosylase 2 [Clostridia bacterium]|nr:DNA-3-methyladenine glycosylase 2 [Clostridia bacterium]